MNKRNNYDYNNRLLQRVEGLYSFIASKGSTSKIGTLCFIRRNFVKYGPIFKLISLRELGEHL